MCLRVRNWKEFQQYRDRCPPWIKLHREILQSEDWVMWDDASRVLAIACMLLASRTQDGTLPSNPEYIRRAAYLNEYPDLRPLIDCGFLVLEGDASKVYGTLATRTTETETETETEAEGEGASAPAPPPKRRVAFVPPTVAEVAEYAAEKSLAIDPQRFVDFYTSKGWMVGKTKMRDWKAAARGWASRDGRKLNPASTHSTANDAVWMYDAYRRTDYDHYRGDPDWDDYVAFTGECEPMKAPTFDEWRNS